MSKTLDKKAILKNSIFFIALIGVTFFILFKDNSITGIMKSLKSVNMIYVFIGISCMFLFIYCEALNIKTLLNMFSYDVSIGKGLKYAFVGFFFSSITPSASGGQPMQIYYMKKDKINISHSSLALLIELASFQLITVSIALIAIIGKYKFILGLNPVIKILIIIGIVLNCSVLAVILLAIFSKKFMLKIIEVVFKVIKKVNFLDEEKIRATVDKEIEQYQQGAIFIKQNKRIVMKVIITTIAQLCFMYSITFFVYKAFNLSTYSFFTIFSIQAILFIAVSAIPLPGAVGSSESSFLTLFKTLFPASTLSSAMLLSRGISFYLFVIISGIIVLFIKIIKRKKVAKYA